MVGIVLSFWEGLFSGDMLVFGYSINKMGRWKPCFKEIHDLQFRGHMFVFVSPWMLEDASQQKTANLSDLSCSKIIWLQSRRWCRISFHAPFRTFRSRKDLKKQQKHRGVIFKLLHRIHWNQRRKPLLSKWSTLRFANFCLMRDLKTGTCCLKSWIVWWRVCKDTMNYWSFLQLSQGCKFKVVSAVTLPLMQFYDAYKVRPNQL